MWKPVGSCVPRLVAASSHLGVAAAVHSAGLSVPVGSRGRLLVTALYTPLTDRDDGQGAADAVLPGQAHTWWPADVDGWLAVSAALHSSTAREIVCGDAASRDLARLNVVLPRLHGAVGWDIGRAGGRLVALVAEMQHDARRPQISDKGDGEPNVHVIHAGRHMTAAPATGWRAFGRLAAVRDTTLVRALGVDPTLYGERGSHMVASILRAEEALGRRWRLDPALADPDAVADLRRSFLAVANARRRTAGAA